MEINYIKNLIISFGVIILLMLINAIYNYKVLNEITQETENLYKHPYTVSNTLFKIQNNLTSMHRYMKDVALAQDSIEIETAINKVSVNENNIYKMIPVLYDRYLGDQQSIVSFEKEFQVWKNIRYEVIMLSVKGKKLEAAVITKGKGAEHLIKVQEALNVLIVYAKNKGDFFFEKTLETKMQVEKFLVVLSVISIILTIMIILYILKITKKSEKIIKDYIYTINKNIYSLSFNLEGKIIEASNAICQFLGVTLDDLKDENIYSIITSDEQRKVLAYSIENGFGWNGEIEYMQDIWLSIDVEPILNEQYKTVKYNMILTDISDKKRIEKVSHTDQLTNLYNRHYFNHIVPIELAHNVREKQSSVFVMIDIDFFKQYNDHYGHPEGDATLKAVANVLNKCLQRPHDYVFRLGGEEFGIFLSDMRYEDSTIFLDKIRQKVEDLCIAHAQSKVSEFVTVSLGGLFLEEDAPKLELDEVYSLADTLLYEAKHTGRNKLVMKKN